MYTLSIIASATGAILFLFAVFFFVPFASIEHQSVELVLGLFLLVPIYMVGKFSFRQMIILLIHWRYSQNNDSKV